MNGRVFRAHYDGNQILLDEPVTLPLNAQLRTPYAGKSGRCTLTAANNDN